MKPLTEDSWKLAWGQALDQTVEELGGTDLSERCQMSGARWRSDDGVAEVELLNRVYQVLPPVFEVVGPRIGEEVPITDRILLLHYLSKASGKPPTGEWISFDKVPGGEIYLPVFRARSIDRLVRGYSGREETLLETARASGGRPAEFGDVSVCIQALPRVPVAVILWRGDEEFSPSGNLLFDATVTEYLPMEDVVVLAGIVATRLLEGR